MSSVGPTGPFAKAPYGGTLSASATSVTVTGLSAGTTYWFKLVVNNGARESAVLAETTDGYTVTYDANGGTGTVTDPAEYAHGALAAVLSGDTLTPPLPGQVFSGWALEPGGAPVRQPGETIYMTQDFTLYAVWTDAPGP
ncbi:MAG: InlB B-repeat-containing protein [Oscillospiraceae bacterium]|nr:InlB B-repeat-containing protein [Oscillospiraceae bacterium]